MVVAVHKSSSLLLNLLQFFMSSIDDGSHTEEEYSRVGLTRDVRLLIFIFSCCDSFQKKHVFERLL